MPRRPLDTIPQEQLAYELRRAIDRAVRRPWDTPTLELIARLIAENPRSVRSIHVMHNLGAARCEWLAAQLEHETRDRTRAGGPPPA
jgi:hypothetical protein